MSKKLRTPLIKPRTQGGTFYTFGSAMEDIGLNINEKSNHIELTHYALIDIPEFDKENLNTYNSYSNKSNTGDMLFAESFQNYALNFETVVRNQNTYNFAINKTCSEKIFWKWLFKIAGKTPSDFDLLNNGLYTDNTNEPIVKAFGQISAGSQRTDDFGIYNETFVQIPSSYGQMKCFFKNDQDENYNKKMSSFQADTYIENISESDELNSDGTIKNTDISAKSIVDDPDTMSYEINSNNCTDFFGIEFDLDKINTYYNKDVLTYDDLGFGIENDNQPTEFSFNAILVYYSIFDANNNNILATNLYGIYIIEKAIEVTAPNDARKYKFASLNKKKTSTQETGTSFSFRLNIKPTSAYSGDIVVMDNSSNAFSMASDFNDVLRNLNSAIRTLSSNSKLIYDMTQDNKSLKNLATQAIDKVNDLEHTINSMKNVGNDNEQIMLKSPNTSYNSYDFNKETAKAIISIANVQFDVKTGNVSVNFSEDDIVTLPENAQFICRNMFKDIQGSRFYDVFKLLSLLIASNK